MPKSLVKKLFLKIFLLFLPFMLIFAYPLWVIVVSGEAVSLEQVVHIEEGSSFRRGYYGLAFFNVNAYYKLLKTQFRKPEILVLGTSRVLQFRRNFFLPHTSFYNAGHGVKYLGEYQSFLELLSPHQKPKLLIINLDQWQFNPNWQANIFRTYKTHSYEEDNKDSRSFLNLLFRNTRKIYLYSFQGIIRNNILWHNFFHQDSIGLAGIIGKQGFREDGSLRHGFFISGRKEHQRLTLLFIKNADAKDMFTYGKRIDLKRLVILRELLEYCQQNKIHVIGFLPPFSPDGFNIIQKKGKEYAYMSKIYPAIAPIFAEYGFTLADFADPASLDTKSSDDEFIDGFHGSEKTYLQILIQLAKRDEYLAKYVNLNFLENLLQNIKDPIYIFND